MSNEDEGRRILVVDDEPQIVRALKVILRGAGYSTDQAESKEEALNAVSVHPPDAMVLDLVLPDGSGVEVCSEVRSWTSLPIIVLSAVGDEREKVRALDAGADDYITKPFGTDELLARLRAALRRVSEDGGEPTIDLGGLVIDLAARTVASGRRGGPPDSHRVRPASRPRAPSGQARHPSAAPAGGLGARLRGRDPLPSRPRRPHPLEDRARAVSPTTPDHGARHRLSASRRALRAWLPKPLTADRR